MPFAFRQRRPQIRFYVEKYNSVISEQSVAKPTEAERLSKNNKRKKRRKNTIQKRIITEREKNEKYLKNLSDNTLTDHQVSVLAKGLKFIETPVTNENKIRQQLLRDFEQFARRMRLDIYSTGMTRSHILSMSSQTGYHQYNLLLPLKATWKMSS